MDKCYFPFSRLVQADFLKEKQKKRLDFLHFCVKELPMRGGRKVAILPRKVEICIFLLFRGLYTIMP